MHRLSLTIAGVAFGAFAAVAFAQNADMNTAGPTRNDYKLGVIAPSEGATINGSSVRVVVNTQVREQLTDPESDRRDVNSMPRPDVDVYLDGALKGTLHDKNNVLQIDDLAPGTHKLTFVAKNLSNEIIDRSEVHFASIEGTAATISPADTSASSGMSTMSHDDGTSTPPTSSATTAPPPPPSYSYSSSSSTSSSTEAPTAPSSRQLPETASNDGALAIAGGALLIAASCLRRASRVA